jgi:hypothetical protein
MGFTFRLLFSLQSFFLMPSLSEKILSYYASRSVSKQEVRMAPVLTLRFAAKKACIRHPGNDTARFRPIAKNIWHG